MKLITTLTALALTPLLALAGNQQDKENREQLTQISRIFVAGEGTAAEKVRDRVGRAKGCFVLTENSADSEAVLQVGLPGGRNSAGALRASGDEVKGELKTKEGTTIWMAGSQVSNSLNHDVAVGIALVSLINTLERDAGCGKRKGALARTQDSGK